MRYIVLAAAMTLIGTAPDIAPLPVNVGGRVVIEADRSISFGWPGTYVEGRFHGTAISVKVDAPTDFLDILIGGRVVRTLRRPGSTTVLIDGLADGDHVIRLEKLTESQTGGTRFFGFYPAGRSVAVAPPPARTRQIEFIGDSYTVGYGNTSTTTACDATQVHDRTDTQQGFGSLVARHYDADYRINAYSGFGIVRNYNGGSPDLNLPALYDRLKPDDPLHLQGEQDGWRPQFVVINLGTNDFSTPVHAGERWPNQLALGAAYRERYVDFVRRIAVQQPQAKIILMASQMFSAQVEQIAASLKTAGSAIVTIVPFSDLELSACNYHPSLKDDRHLALLLQDTIDRLAWR